MHIPFDFQNTGLYNFNNQLINFIYLYLLISRYCHNYSALMPGDSCSQSNRLR
jgi:hypothetical protein